MKYNSHRILIKRVSIQELKRKATKARRKAHWTVEDIDLAEREGQNLYHYFNNLAQIMRISENDFNKLMLGSHAKIRDNSSVQTPNMESFTGDKPVEKKRIEGFDTPVNITVHSYRYRLCDSDGISAKAVIDQIVKDGILQDDSAKFVKEVRFKQTKIKKSEEEKTVIIIESI